VTGSSCFVNFLSGGLVSAAVLIGGDQGDYFIGGPGTNTIKGGAGNDTIYAHPANAALKDTLDIQAASSITNGVTSTLTVIVNGKLALSQVPVTADQSTWETQDIRVDLSSYGNISSLVIRADNASCCSGGQGNTLFVQSISLNAVDIPLSESVPSGSTLDTAPAGSTALTGIYLISTGASLTFSGAALQVVPPFLSNTADTIDGGGGTNIVIYGRPFGNYSVVKLMDGSLLVTSRATPEGPDRLTNIQKLQFADETIDAASIPQVSPPMITSVVNGADFKTETLSPGAWISLLGQNLGQGEAASSSNTLTLGGASVTVCGIPAVLNYNSGPITTNGSTGWQINALVPDGVAGQTLCPVVVTLGAQASPPVNVAIAGGIVELFQFTTSAGTLPIITHADYSLVGPVSAGLAPANPNETVIAWATGDCSTPVVTIGVTPATVTYAGRVGPGLCQINFVVPNVPAGSNQLTVSTSPSAYSLWVSQ